MEVLSSRVVIHPDDFHRSRRFYEADLQLHLFHEYGDGHKTVGAVYFLGGGYLELAATSPGRLPGHTKLWLQVPEIRPVEERLTGRGVPVTRPAARMPWGLIEMEIEDPDGIRIVIVEVPEDHFLRKRL